MRYSPALLAGMAALFPFNLWAQTPGETAAAGPTVQDSAGANSVGLQDIVVTAQRRSENLQRAALAISAVSGSVLSDAGVTRPNELTSIVPSLQVAPSAGPYSLFYVRGVGNFNGNALSDSAVAFNVDGVYVGRASSTTGFFYDLERVEVVKGPQGTLYGRNATGGAINVISHKPRLGETAARASVEYGNYNSVRAEGVLNLSVGDNSALRLAGVLVRHDPYMEDGTDNQKDFGARLSFLTEPAKDLSIHIVGDYFRQRGAGQGGTPAELGVENRPGYLSPQGRAFYASRPNNLLGRTFAPLDTNPYMNNKYWGLSSAINYVTPAGTIALIPAYREGELDLLTETPGFYIQQREKDKQFSFEGRIASDDKWPLRYILGMFYYDESNDIPFYFVNQQANVNFTNYKQKIKSMAVFGRLTYAITPDLRVNGGARFTTEDKSLSGVLYGAIRPCVVPSAFFPTYVPGCPNAQPFGMAEYLPSADFNPAPDGSLTIPNIVDLRGQNAKRSSVEKVTYRVGMDWDITPRNLLYGSVETGFKSGGFFFTADEGLFRPEKITAYTVGSKNKLFSNRLQLNLELFYWKYRDQQISHLINDSRGNSAFGTENVGKATFKGFELETRFSLREGTTLSADVQYLDAKYNSFIYLTPNVNGGIGNGTACPNVGIPGTSYTVDCSGRRPPNAPRWTVNLGAQQIFNFGNGGRLTLDLLAHYQSETLTGLEFTSAEYQDAYWQVNSQVNYALPGSRWRVGAYVLNAFDKTVVANTFPVPLSNFTAASLRPPRTYGVRLSFDL